MPGAPSWCSMSHARQTPPESISHLMMGRLLAMLPHPVDGRSLPRPFSPYGSCKLCGEAYCGDFAASYGIDITSLRFANVIGPRSLHKEGAVAAFFKAISEGRLIMIYGNGSAIRDSLYMGDLGAGTEAGFDQ